MQQNKLSKKVAYYQTLVIGFLALLTDTLLRIFPISDLGKN